MDFLEGRARTRENAENAIRDVFRGRKGRISVAGVETMLASRQWTKVYGKGWLAMAWKGLVKEGYVKKSGTHWVWQDGGADERHARREDPV